MLLANSLVSQPSQSGTREQIQRFRMAETEGFEPSVRESPVRRFSKPLVSATHPRLRERPKAAAYIGEISRLQPARLLFDRDVQSHVEAHGLARIEDPHAKLGPVALRFVQRGVGVGDWLGDADPAACRRIDLEESRLGR